MATQYVQGTQRCEQTWDMLGRLVHAALQVGMYRQPLTPNMSHLTMQQWKRSRWSREAVTDKKYYQCGGTRSISVSKGRFLIIQAE
jgi:hypothetical protein